MYEERLSVADARRYEIEDTIVSLQEQLRNQGAPQSPSTPSRHGSSATEIDNEALREQIQHLQSKISTLEDALEDTRAAAERDDVAIRDRIKRYKEREEHMRAELVEGRKEVERLSKEEERARLKLEEIGEALRESAVALENAQAEVEGLRNDVAVCKSYERVNSILTMRRPASRRPECGEHITFLRFWFQRRSSQTSAGNCGIKINC